FVIVMPETDLHVAGMVAERVRRSIAGEPFAVSKGAKCIEVTISIGLSTLEIKGESVADVVKRADIALYRAKHDGRNRVVAQAAYSRAVLPKVARAKVKQGPRGPVQNRQQPAEILLDLGLAEFDVLARDR